MNQQIDEQLFYDRFVDLLKLLAERHGLDSIHDALIVWYGENFLYLDPDEIKERIVEDSHAEGVDALLINEINLELLFIQARTVESFDNTKRNYSENDIKSTLDGVRFLISSNYKGKITPNLENLVDEYHDLDNTCDYVTKVVFLTLKKPPVDDKFILSFSEDFPKVQVLFYDFNSLLSFYGQYLAMRAPAPKRITLEVIRNILDKDAPIQSRVFTCKGKDLARIYNEHRETIFQQNVRYFLGSKSRSINKQIAETAGNEEQSRDFWYFNNGITIVCTKISESSSRTVVTLHDAQIINGAQTTYALNDAFNEGTLRDDVEVLIKAIQTEDTKFIESVTLYTNSQNAIRLRDLCSNDIIQIMVQQTILSSYRYFYERKRGELDSLYRTADEKRTLLGDDYRYRVMGNENAMQAFLALYLDKPAQAKAEKGRLFMKDKAGFYDMIFRKDDGILPEKLLLSWKLLEYIEGEKSDYYKFYKQAEKATEEEAEKIYAFDFILHAEYFILNLLKDFLLNDGSNIEYDKSHLLHVIDMVNNSDERLKLHYETIKSVLAEYMGEAKKQRNYYHNRFFKNEKSIGLLRNFFKQKFEFVEV